jgi:hypothetical protein
MPPAGLGAQPPLPGGLRYLVQKWIRVTTKPGAQSFANELPTANWPDIWFGLLLLGVVTAAVFFAIITFVKAIVLNVLSDPNVSPTVTPAQHQVVQRIFDLLPPFAVSFVILVPLGFFVGMGIYWLFAKLFGGVGSFKDQAYAYSLSYVPIQLVSLLVSLVPFLGGLAAAALGIYGIVLAVFSLMASHRLSGGRATAVVLLPVAIVLILACGLFVALAIAARSFIPRGGAY